MVHVYSEVGRLRSVLVHRPGREVDNMVPSMMDELLYDDILYGDAAREEHDEFRAVLQHLDIEVVEIQDLLREILERGDARAWLIDALVENLSVPEVDRLRATSAYDLAESLVAGDRIDTNREDFGPEELFEIPPIPNWCFQRDPQLVLGDKVAYCSMATPARWRETVLSRAIFKFHPRFRPVYPWIDPILPEVDSPLLLGLRRPAYEGGDILVLSRDVVAVGYSERTNRTGIRQLARALRRGNGPRWLFVVDIPAARSFMHLDTVMTPIDRDLCLVHGPVILPGGDQPAKTYEMDLHGSDDLHARFCGDLLPALARRGVDLDHVLCGGKDPVDQQREQWTDGANAFALAPGVIVLYDRNDRTVEQLSARGFDIVRSTDILEGRVRLDLDHPKRTCILVPSSELSRARGGPHCLTQPLVRDL